jgi:Kef-type K+ transport system membrane component KefB
MHGNIVYIIGLSIIVATVLAYLTRATRQPLLLAYIGAGLLLGPQGLGWVTDYDEISVLSELGLAFLLFIVGLEIDVKKLVKVGKASFVTGFIQIAFSIFVGVWFAGLLGYVELPAVYIAITLAFSSTMIVVKLLSDKAELDTISGRITLSILLLQDIFAIIVLALQTSLRNPSALSIGLSLINGLGLAAGSLLVARYVLPHVFRYAAKSPELLLISSLSWCFFVCGMALASNFSLAMGALIAGVSISSFPYNIDVVAKIRSLRDFFVTLFFISLGFQITITSREILGAGLLLSGLVIISRWVSILPTLYLQKFGTRVGILSSINLMQASEFSLVIAAIGFQLGHISQEIVSLIAIALIITTTASTYAISANHRITKILVKLLSLVRLRDEPQHEEEAPKEKAYDIVLLGCHRVAGSLIHSLSQTTNRYLVVDFNPEILKKLKDASIPCAYADLSHIETLEHLGLQTARVIVSSISDDFLRGIDNLTLVRTLRKLSPDSLIISAAENAGKAIEMYHAGANYVLLPRHLAADHLVRVIEKAVKDDLSSFQKTHLATIQDRFEIL